MFTVQDVAATSLFVACKIEDTLKKSREILCASYNLRHSQAEPINSDNPVIPHPPIFRPGMLTVRRGG